MSSSNGPAYGGPQGPHSHILMTGGGRGGTSDFFGSEILPNSDFFLSMKDAGIFFLGREIKQKDILGVAKKWIKGLFWGLLKKGLWDFFGYAKRSSNFFG